MSFHIDNNNNPQHLFSSMFQSLGEIPITLTEDLIANKSNTTTSPEACFIFLGPASEKIIVALSASFFFLKEFFFDKINFLTKKNQNLVMLFACCFTFVCVLQIALNDQKSYFFCRYSFLSFLTTLGTFFLPRNMMKICCCQCCFMCQKIRILTSNTIERIKNGPKLEGRKKRGRGRGKNQRTNTTFFMGNFNYNFAESENLDYDRFNNSHHSKKNNKKKRKHNDDPSSPVDAFPQREGVFSKIAKISRSIWDFLMLPPENLLEKDKSKLKNNHEAEQVETQPQQSSPEPPRTQLNEKIQFENNHTPQRHGGRGGLSSKRKKHIYRFWSLTTFYFLVFVYLSGNFLIYNNLFPQSINLVFF